MNPKYKRALFFPMIFAVMAPYFGFIIYFSSRYPSGQWPAWFVDTIAIWFIANFLVITFFIKWMAKGSVVEPEKARVARAKSTAQSTRLVILWSLFFLYGVKETVQGKFPLSRAIPAGAFLLLFIGIFGWGIYREKRKRP